MREMPLAGAERMIRKLETQHLDKVHDPTTLILFFCRMKYTAYNERQLKGLIMENWKTRLKKTWDESPLTCIALGIFALGAAAKVMNANTERQNAKSWAKEVDRRRMVQK